MFNRQAENDTQLARGLGWASIGIGLTELAATRKVQDMLGLEDSPARRGILRVLGVREVMHGIGLLSQTRPNHQMRVGAWARVLGDALDTALLGAAATKTKKPASFAVVSAMVAGIGLLDAVTASRLQMHKHSDA